MYEKKLNINLKNPFPMHRRLHFSRQKFSISPKIALNKMSGHLIIGCYSGHNLPVGVDIIEKDSG